MNVRDTSILSYIQLKKTNLGEKQAAVYNALKTLNARKFYPTDRELTKEMGFMDPNKVRPRRFELVKMGLVDVHSHKICSVSGKVALSWHIVKKWKLEVC